MKLRKIKPDHELQKRIIVAEPKYNEKFEKIFKKKAFLTLATSPNATKDQKQKSLGTMLKEALNRSGLNSDGEQSENRNGDRKSTLIRRVLPVEKLKKRVPDSDHLTRMRALLVAAHVNDAFIKKLAAGNSYIPANLDPEGSKEMGDSFSQVYMKSNVRLQRKLEKADKEANKGTAESTSPEAIEALIRGDEIN